MNISCLTRDLSNRDTIVTSFFFLEYLIVAIAKVRIYILFHKRLISKI